MNPSPAQPEIGPVPQPRSVAASLARRLGSSNAMEAEAAFQDAVREHGAMVVAACRNLCAEDAEDAAQLTFLLLWRKRRALPPSRPLTGWLFRSARWIAGELHRARARRKARERSAVAMAPLCGPAEEKSDTQALLSEALAALPERDREAILLHCAESRSQKEVADLLGCTEEAARKRIARGLDRLRGWYARRGVAVTALLLATSLASATAASAAAAKRLPLGPHAALPPEVHSFWKALLWTNACKEAALALIAVLLLASAAGVGMTVLRNPEVETRAPAPGPTLPTVKMERAPAQREPAGLVHLDDFAQGGMDPFWVRSTPFGRGLRFTEGGLLLLETARAEGEERGPVSAEMVSRAVPLGGRPLEFSVTGGWNPAGAAGPFELRLELLDEDGRLLAFAGQRHPGTGTLMRDLEAVWGTPDKTHACRWIRPSKIFQIVLAPSGEATFKMEVHPTLLRPGTLQLDRPAERVSARLQVRADGPGGSVGWWIKRFQVIRLEAGPAAVEKGPR